MRQNSVGLILGMKGTGKSELLHRIAKDAPRVMIVDTMGEHARDGFERVFGELDELLDAMVRAHKLNRFRLALQPRDRGDAPALMRLAFELDRFLFVVDELGWYCSPVSVPEELATLIRFGRHRAIDQIYTARRAAELPIDVRANSDWTVSFRQQHPDDAKALAAVWGEPAYQVLELAPAQEHPPRAGECLLFGNASKAPLAAAEAALGADTNALDIDESVSLESAASEQELESTAPVESGSLLDRLSVSRTGAASESEE